LNVVRVSLEPDVAVNISSKAVMAGIPMVAAVGAPCSLAVQVAREFDVIPVGLHRDNRFIVYRGADRIHTNPDCSRREA
jgi:FdhD protein